MVRTGHTPKLFGPTVLKLSQAVVKHYYLVFEHPESAEKEEVGFDQAVHVHKENHAMWDDVETREVCRYFEG